MNTVTASVTPAQAPGLNVAPASTDLSSLFQE